MVPVLMIIDLQEDFFADGILKDNRSKLVTKTNQLVDYCDVNTIPVIWIRQEYKSDLSDAPSYMKRNRVFKTIENNDGSRLLHELHVSDKHQNILKKRFSAFFGTDLSDLLKKMGIDTVIISGINTMTCVRVTAIDAYQYDFSVILATDCVYAYDLEQHDNSLKYLQYSVSKAMNNDEIMSEF